MHHNKMLEWLAAALLGSAALTLPAQAIKLDGLSEDQGPVIDTTIDGAGVTSGFTQIFDTELVGPVQRKIDAELTATDLGGRLEMRAAIASGFFSHAQSPGENGRTRITWTFPAQPLADPVEIGIDLTFVDRPARHWQRSVSPTA